MHSLPSFRFLLAGRVIGGDVPTEIVLNLSSSTTVAIRPEQQRGAQSLAVFGGGYPSEESAREAGLAAARIVMLAGVVLGVGLYVGTMETEGHSPHPYLGTAGLHVFEDRGDRNSVVSLNLTGRLITRMGTEEVQRALAEGASVQAALTRKEVLAIQLYNQSHFQSADAARLVSLMSTLEVLANRERRSLKAQALLEVFVAAAAESELVDSEKQPLTAGIQDLRRESISSACRRLVRRHCGEGGLGVFQTASRLRGSLLHEGQPAESENLGAAVIELDRLVRQVISGHVRAIGTS